MKTQAQLYQSVILAHSREPFNFKTPASSTHKADVQNATCGDKLSVYLTLSANNNIDKINFTAQGCALCIASASIICKAIQNQSTDTVETFSRSCKAYLAGDQTQKVPEDFKAFAGIEAYPARIKCAELIFNGLNSALDFQP